MMAFAVPGDAAPIGVHLDAADDVRGSITEKGLPLQSPVVKHKSITTTNDTKSGARADARTTNPMDFAYMSAGADNDIADREDVDF